VAFTTMDTAASDTTLRSTRSMSRPGVAMTMSGALRTAARSGPRRTQRGPAVDGAAERLEHVGHLHGELTRGYEHERGRPPRVGAWGGGEGGEAEGQRLA
jgi:hypothetical protein